jgi:uncharacterized protein (DUF983 family)
MRSRDQHDDEEIDDEDDAGFDPEGPDPSEMDSSDDPDLDVCPHCRKLITEEAERCHHCGGWLSAEDAPLSRPAWFVIAVVLALAVVLLVWIF